ncbi:MAG: toxin-antitoxin system HicB family antitoxin [Pseudomonadota bacterium]
MTRNATLSIDETVLRKARVLAARRGLSVSALLREQILRLVGDDEAYEAARGEVFRRWDAGATHLGGGALPAREEAHDRAGLR